MTVEKTSTEAMPGHLACGFSVHTRRRRQSIQCLPLRPGACKRKVAACRTSDIEPSRLPCEVLVTRRKVRFTMFVCMYVCVYVSL